MAGLFGLSIDPKNYEGNFSEDLFWETFYRQHLGEQYGGLSTHKEGQKIKIQTHRGLFRPTFQNNLAGLEGTEGIPASLVRKRLGAALARRDIERGFIPDIVAPVPDSGRFHAIGYFEEFCRQIMAGKIDRIPFYDEVLLKWPYAGRSFTPQEEKERKLEAHIKLLVSGEDYNDKVLVINDDSIVRGTQTSENLVPKAESMGFKEIHFRISNPELHSYCPYGKTTKKGELFAAAILSKEERIKFLGSRAKNKGIVKGLEYNTIKDLVEAIGLAREKLCVDCDLKTPS